MDTITCSRKVLADTFKFYLLAHNYHWNVEGILFYQFHELFGNIYEEVFASVDPLAEFIRAMGGYAPGSCTHFQELSTLQDSAEIPEAQIMVVHLLAENDKVLTTLTEAMHVANDEGHDDYSNFLQERIAAHKKHAWMLRATTK
jgi:starvation-inducible DNA-binding protein